MSAHRLAALLPATIPARACGVTAAPPQDTRPV